MAPSPEGKDKESKIDEPQVSNPSSSTSQGLSLSTEEPAGPPRCRLPSLFSRQYSTIPLDLRPPPGQTQLLRSEEVLEKALELLVTVQRQAFERATKVPGLVHPQDEGDSPNLKESRVIWQESTRSLEALVGVILSRIRDMDANISAAGSAAQPPHSNAQAQPEDEAGSSQQQTMVPQSGDVRAFTQPYQSSQYGAGQSSLVTSTHQLPMLNTSLSEGLSAQPPQSNFQYGSTQDHQSSTFFEHGGPLFMSSGLGLGQGQQFSMGTGHVGMPGESAEGESFVSELNQHPRPTFETQPEKSQPAEFPQNDFSSTDFPSNGLDADDAAMSGMQDGQAQQAQNFLAPNIDLNTFSAGGDPDPMRQYSGSTTQQAPDSYGNSMFSGMTGVGAGQNSIQHSSTPMSPMPNPHQRPAPELARGQMIPIHNNGRAHLYLSTSRALCGQQIPERITHILNVTQEQLDKKQLKPFKDRERYGYAPLNEDAPASVEGLIKAAHTEIILKIGGKVFDEGGHLLVLDTTGVNRAPAVIMIILMEIFGMNMQDAWDKVQRGRQGCVKLKGDMWWNVRDRAGLSLKLPEQQPQNLLPPQSTAYQGPIPQYGQPLRTPHSYHHPMVGSPIGQQKQLAFNLLENFPEDLQWEKAPPQPMQYIADRNLTVFSAHVPQEPNNPSHLPNTPLTSANPAQSYSSPYAQPSASATSQHITPPSQPEEPADSNLDPQLQQPCPPPSLAGTASQQEVEKPPTPPKSKENSEVLPSPATKDACSQPVELSSGQDSTNSPAAADATRNARQHAAQRPVEQIDGAASHSKPDQRQSQSRLMENESIQILDVVAGISKLYQFRAYISCASRNVAPVGENMYVLDLDGGSSPYIDFPFRLRPNDELKVADVETFTNQCIENRRLLLIHTSKDPTALRVAAGAAFFILCKFERDPEKAIQRLKSLYLPLRVGLVKNVCQSLRLPVPAWILAPPPDGNVPQAQCQASNSVQPRPGLPAAPISGMKRTSASLPGGSMPPSSKKPNLSGGEGSNNVPDTTGQGSQSQAPTRLGFPPHALKPTTMKPKIQGSKPTPETERKSIFDDGTGGTEPPPKRGRGRPKKIRTEEEASTALAAERKKKKTKSRQDDNIDPSLGQATNEPEAGQNIAATTTSIQNMGKPTAEKDAAVANAHRVAAESNHLTAFVINHIAPKSRAALDRGIPLEIVQPMEQAAVHTVNNRVHPLPTSQARGSRLFKDFGRQPQITYDTDPEFARLPAHLQEARVMGRSPPDGLLHRAMFRLEAEHAQRGMIADHQQRGNSTPLFEHPIQTYGPRLDRVYATMNALPAAPQPVPAVPNHPRQQNGVLRNPRSALGRSGAIQRRSPNHSDSERSSTLSPPMFSELQPRGNHSNPFAPAMRHSIAWETQRVLDGQYLLAPVEDAVSFRDNFNRDEYQMTPSPTEPSEILNEYGEHWENVTDEELLDFHFNF